MSLTVNTKPSGFRPIGGGELIYEFTESSLSGKSNYSVNIWLNGLSSIVPIHEYRPDANLNIEADIAPLLRAALAMESDPASRHVSTYVEYQAVWDEGSDSPVALSGDVIFAYVGVNHRLNSRTKYYIDNSGGNFLIPTSKLYVWPDRTTTVEFLNDSGMGGACAVGFYDSNNTFYSIGGFDGTNKGFQSFDYIFPDSGTFKVYSFAVGDWVAEIEVVMLEECNNPVYLKWINDLGGLSTWLFGYNQLYELVPEALYRTNNILLVADVLSWEVWQMLQELNKDGIEYGDNKKSGVFCQDFTNESNPIYLFPVPLSRQTATKRLVHQFELTVRYPQIPNIDI